MSIKVREAIAGRSRNIMSSRNLIERICRDLALELEKIDHHLQTKEPRHAFKFGRAQDNLYNASRYLAAAALELEQDKCTTTTT